MSNLAHHWRDFYEGIAKNGFGSRIWHGIRVALIQPWNDTIHTHANNDYKCFEILTLRTLFRSTTLTEQ